MITRVQYRWLMYGLQAMAVVGLMTLVSYTAFVR